jgi:crotonobetainyl-CoA:carnitine CoA-transferase CaiB-like acyl-CoA transferase
MEVPMAAVAVRQGSVKMVMMAMFEALVVLGSTPLSNGDAHHPADHRRPNGAGDYRDAALIGFFFSSLLLPLIA